MHESNSVSHETPRGLHLGAVELIQKPGSHLRYVNLQEWGHKTYNFAHQKATVDRDATLQWTLAAMGSLLSKVNQSVDLVGPGADSQVNGVMFTEGRQHVAYHTLQHHRAPSCHSDFLYKAAQQDKSRTVWRGMIKVDKEAQKTDGYQRNDNLVLSQPSRADSIPGLEIEADDVRCTHGSTTAKVDEEQIFYARCRGFTRKEATRMIVSGFFQQIFDRITIESVRDALADAIARQVRDLRAMFPEVKNRSDKRKLYALVSNGASFQLRKTVLNRFPQIIGQRMSVWMAVDDDVDMLLKGHIRRDAPEGSRRLSDKQLAWIDRFIAEGKLEKRFNKTFFTVGDSREPEQAREQLVLPA